MRYVSCECVSHTFILRRPGFHLITLSLNARERCGFNIQCRLRNKRSDFVTHMCALAETCRVYALHFGVCSHAKGTERELCSQNGDAFSHMSSSSANVRAP